MKCYIIVAYNYDRSMQSVQKHRTKRDIQERSIMFIENLLYYALHWAFDSLILTTLQSRLMLFIFYRKKKELKHCFKDEGEELLCDYKILKLRFKLRSSVTQHFLKSFLDQIIFPSICSISSDSFHHFLRRGLWHPQIPSPSASLYN